MLRLATLADVDVVFKLCQNFSATLKQTTLVDDDKLRSIVEDFLSSSNDEKVVLLYDDVGMLAAFVRPYLLSHEPIATEIAWWVEPEFRKSDVGRQLVEAFEFWAKKLNCKYAVMSCYADNDIGKFYEKQDYVLHEKTFIKEL